MNDNVRQIFNMLGVEPNEKFKVDGYPNEYELDENLYITVYHGGEFTGYGDTFYSGILNGQNKIIKLTKKSKKKLRDLTKEEYIKWGIEKCKGNCEFCPFQFVKCDSLLDTCWINYKELYSDEFLEQEIEVE